MKRGSMAIVLAALLAATIVGVVWARPNQAPEGVVRKVTIPAAAFIPREDGLDWTNKGKYLAINSGNWVPFSAPVVFPCVERVTVKKVTLSIDDENGNEPVCLAMWRSSPKNFTAAYMAEVCNSPSLGLGPHNYTDNTIQNAQVDPAHGAYLVLNIDGANIYVYGVTIEYRRQM